MSNAQDCQFEFRLAPRMEVPQPHLATPNALLHSLLRVALFASLFTFFPYELSEFPLLQPLAAASCSFVPYNGKKNLKVFAPYQGINSTEQIVISLHTYFVISMIQN